MYYRHTVWGIAAVVIGALLGNAVDRLPISAVAQSILAMIVAWHVGLGLVSFVLVFRSPYASERSATSPATGKMLLTTVAAGVAGFMLHAAVSWKGMGVGADLLRYRTEGIGIAGFVAGSIQAVAVCGLDDCV